jgi:hypothetical protein
MTKTTLRNNGLSIALFSLFLLTEIGLSIAGYRHYNAEQLQHNRPVISYVQYLGSAAFFEVTMENCRVNFADARIHNHFDDAPIRWLGVVTSGGIMN